jgi:hypothetical protein
VPSQVRGVRAATTIAIQMQGVRTPVKLVIKVAMSRMKTQPAPYRVKKMLTKQKWQNEITL